MLASTTARPTSLDQLISAELCARLDRIDIISRKIFAGKLQGERRSKRRGQSVEFEDYRNYVAGDDLRHVDWNIFARLEKFFIKIFQEEEDLAVHVVLDATASMDAGSSVAPGSPHSANKLTLAMRLAMSLAYVAIVNNDRVNLSVFNGTTLRRIGPLRGRRNVQRVGAFLLEYTQPPGVSVVGASRSGEGAGTDIDGSSEADGSKSATLGVAGRGDFTSALRSIAASRTGKGVMVVLSDFLIPGGYQEGLRLLAGGGSGRGGSGSGGYDTYCLQVLSPGELDPSLEGAAVPEGWTTRGKSPPTGREFVGDMRLIDAETGRSTEVTVTADVIRKYKAAVEGYMNELKSFCTARDMSYGMVRSDADVESLLLDYLRRRGLLR